MSVLSRQVKTAFLKSCEAISEGSLRLRTPEGTWLSFGQGAPEAELRLGDWSVVMSTRARGDIGFGEAYVAGLWDSPSIETLIELAVLNERHFGAHHHGGFWQALAFRTLDRVLRRNSRRGASGNIRAHYDVGNEFFQLWLDPSMTYSAALFAPGDGLEAAQARKYNRILDRLTGGERVLELGCGWGGFAERAADAGREVTGITISPSQKGYADARLDGRARIELCDYRDTKGRFANIVSIEMVEAVGERYWPQYFATVKARLAEGGTAMIQAITVPDARFARYRTSSDYIRRYIFPGGMLLSEGAIARAASKAGLVVRDTLRFGPDYATTCRLWAERMEAEAPRIRRFGYDDGFLRSWRYYLRACAGAFAAGSTNVVQVEVGHA